MDRTSVIVNVTESTRPLLTPELTLRLITSASPWWRLTPEDLSQQGIPEPFWGFAWSGGQALARYVLDHPELVRGKDIVDFGAGGGIVSLAAEIAGARSVVATEIDDWAIECYRLNRPLGDIRLEDWIGRPLTPGSVLLCGDMSYGRDLVDRLIPWFSSLVDVRILIGDASRGFVDSRDFLELATYQAPADYDADGRYFIKASVLEFNRHFT